MEEGRPAPPLTFGRVLDSVRSLWLNGGMRHGADPTRAAHIGEDKEEFEIVLPEKETIELPAEPNPVQEPDVTPAPEPQEVPGPAEVPAGEPVPLEVPAWVTR